MRKNSRAVHLLKMSLCFPVAFCLIIGLFVSCGHKDNTPVYWTDQDLIKIAVQRVECTDTATQVNMQDEKFIPQEVTIQKNGVVKWTNNDQWTNYYLIFQDVTIDNVPPGESACLKFFVQGKYPYRCAESVTGMVIVE